MTTKTIKLIAFIVLLVHGIGHFQGVVASLGVKISPTAGDGSWLLKSFSEQTNRIVSFSIFIITGIAGILTALSFFGILFQASTWEPLAIFTAVMSTICLVLFWNSFAMFFNKIGAIAVNLIIYYSVLFAKHWPAVLFED